LRCISNGSFTTHRYRRPLLERHIPPVAKMDDVAEATMEMDLRERVVTTPIERALADFLEVYAKPRTIPRRNLFPERLAGSPRRAASPWRWATASRSGVLL